MHRTGLLSTLSARTAVVFMLEAKQQVEAVSLGCLAEKGMHDGSMLRPQVREGEIVFGPERWKERCGVLPRRGPHLCLLQ